MAVFVQVEINLLLFTNAKLCNFIVYAIKGNDIFSDELQIYSDKKSQAQKSVNHILRSGVFKVYT